VAAGETSYPLEMLRDLGLLLVALTLARRPAPQLALGHDAFGPEEYSRAR
jgi:hypothetical protein